uniref:DUF2735 domain-containing protein n=1 Tax=Heterorhabditis bacteriophora TaxID=37862 RepID=A0A1I7X615_HETBA
MYDFTKETALGGHSRSTDHRRETYVGPPAALRGPNYWVQAVTSPRELAATERLETTDGAGSTAQGHAS